jgi:hypothetical protein
LLEIFRQLPVKCDIVAEEGEIVQILLIIRLRIQQGFVAPYQHSRSGEPAVGRLCCPVIPAEGRGPLFRSHEPLRLLDEFGAADE